MKSVSKSQMFTITTEISDDMLAKMKASPKLAIEAVQQGADFWHSKILSKHFEADARTKYGYAQRTLNYARRKAAYGLPDLIGFGTDKFGKGSLRTDLKARASYTLATKTLELKMSARVLNFVPNMPQQSNDLKINQRNGNGYPNLKREIKAITDDEREAVAFAVVKALEAKFSPAFVAPSWAPN